MKPISEFLQQLIDEANKSLATSKERILYVYNQAIAEDYTPKEARRLVEEKIVNVSKRYLTEVLPLEAKRPYEQLRHSLINVNSEQTPNQNESRHIKIEPEEEEKPNYENESIAALNEIEKGEIESEEFLKREKETQQTEQLLREERVKNAELLARIEQRDKKIEELDGQVAEHAYRMQELSRKLTEQNTQVIDAAEQEEIEKPSMTQHWTQTVDSECQFCHKITPWYIRHFISGKVLQLVDRERYKELYGMVPAE